MNLKLLTIAFAIILPFSSIAEEGKTSINYDYVEVSSGDAKSVDGSSDLTSFGGSLSVGENFTILVNRVSIDDIGEEVGGVISKIGAGYHATIQKNTDFQISASYFRLEAEAGDYQDNGIQVSVGTATMLSDNTELSLAYNHYNKMNDFSKGHTIKIIHSLTDSIALQASIDSINVSEGKVEFSAYGIRYKL
jgi:hypothetical protein